MKIELTLNEEDKTIEIKTFTAPNAPKPKGGYSNDPQTLGKILYMYEVALGVLIHDINPEITKKMVWDGFKFFVGKFLKK